MQRKTIALIVAFVMGFSLPLYTGEGAGAIAYISKEFGLDLIARMLASRMLRRLGDSVVGTINRMGSEKKDQPTFVQNWKAFLGEAKGIGENQFRAQLNYTVQKGILCDDLKGPLAFTFQASDLPFIDIGDPKKNSELRQDSLLPYQTRIKCTIPDKTREDFKESFEEGGGWETWSRMVEPQNNLLGALRISIAELEKQRETQKESRAGEVTAGQGFRGITRGCQKATGGEVTSTVCYKNCATREDTKNHKAAVTSCGGDDTNDSSKNCYIQFMSSKVSATDNICQKECAGATALGANATCSFAGNIVTPAKILGEGAANWLDNNSKWLVTSDELSEVIVSIINAALNKLGNFVGDSVQSKAETAPEETQKAPDYTSGAEQDRQSLEQIRDNTSRIGTICSDIDNDGTINEIDCGAPENDNCSICGGPSACADIDYNGTINEIDCGAPENKSCNLCN